MTPVDPTDLTSLTLRLRERDDRRDELVWPDEAVNFLREAGCFRSVVEAKFGGRGALPREQLSLYEAVAAGSLTLALILTQHDAACELLGDCDNAALADRVLRACVTSDTLLTVGISQLTTSRRTTGPAMRATEADNGFTFTGVMPWVTSAPKADHIVTGAVLPDGMQILACIPTATRGVDVAEPMALMALGSSWTAEVRCENVHVTPDMVMRGPLERVLALRAAVKPLSVSAVGVGMAGAMLREIEARWGTELRTRASIGDRIVQRYRAIRTKLFDAADLVSDPSAELPSMDIRVGVNDLVVRLATTLLTLSKGSGYLSRSPVQRLVREAMFFLVWSAPPHVQSGTIERLWSTDSEQARQPVEKL